MDDILTLIPAPPDVHAMFAGEKSGEILSEPVMAIAVVKGGPKSLTPRIPRVMVMDTASDQLVFPGDIKTFLGVGSPEDIDNFWTKQSVVWHDDQAGIGEELSDGELDVEFEPPDVDDEFEPPDVDDEFEPPDIDDEFEPPDIDDEGFETEFDDDEPEPEPVKLDDNERRRLDGRRRRPRAGG